MTERMFPLSTFSTAIAVVAGMGVNFDALAEEAGIPHGLLGDPSALITARQYHDLALFASVLYDDPGLGLFIADLIRLEMFDVLGPLFATSGDVRAYLLDSIRFMPLIDPCVDIRLEEDGDEARYTCDVLSPFDADTRFFHAEAIFAGGFRLMQSVFKRHDVGAFRVEFRHDGSDWLEEYRKRFGPDVEIVFNAPANVSVFRRELLALRNPGHSPAIHAHMEKLALARLAALPSVATTSAEVLRVLEREAGRRVMDIGDVAAELGMTTRTLQRRLVDERTTFQKLRDGLRLRQAQAMLRDDAADFATIAATLGFSEPASFHRAFKAWSGLSPAEFRRRQRGGA